MAPLKYMDGVWRGPATEMKLERVGDTDWPLGTPIPPK